MTDQQFERHMKPGADPAETGYLDPSYREAIADGMRIQYNVPVPMRDGVSILADLFLPENATSDVPAIIGWGAYGKQRVPAQYAPGSGVLPEWTSKYCVFEAPDPVYWTSHGYAVAYVNPRGTWYTDGVMRGHLNKNEAEDIHDLIEWLGTRDWSNGKVGMTGVSYYAIVQWFAAATRPPHLAAINPWEGFSDRYRETVFHGGILEDGLNNLWWNGETKYSLRETEDGWRMLEEHRLFDEYWDENKADLERIEVPAYVVASWSDHGLHTRGTLEGFKRIKSKHKWLEVHGQKKWEYQFRPENVERLRVFFDHFLKGLQNELEEWPPVRIEIRDRVQDEEYLSAWRSEAEWPLARTDYRPLYLDAGSGRLQTEPSAEPAEVAYDSEAPEGRAEFVYTFDQPTELTGHMKLRLWVSAPDADDLDLFVAIDKVDADGQRANFAFFSVFLDGSVALGWLRASHRELDDELSTPHQPVHTHAGLQKLSPGEVVPVEIEIWPSSTSFLAGESLKVTVQGRDTFTYPEGVVSMTHTDLVNVGQHVIHTGGSYDSHLLVPVIPATDNE